MPLSPRGTINNRLVSMKNKVVLFVTTIIILVISLVGINYYSNISSQQLPASSRNTTDISEIKAIPTQTGGIVEPLSTPDQKDSDAMSILMRQIPLTTSNFVITYNYRKGKFIVAPANTANNIEESFNLWHNMTPYRDIPVSRFVIISQ